MKPRRAAIGLGLFLAVFTAVVPRGYGMPVPSGMETTAAASSREKDLARARDVLRRDDVRKSLSRRGITAAQAEARLASLSNEELRCLADDAQAGGNADVISIIFWSVMFINAILYEIFFHWSAP
ncbi:MAG: PA2779 family protein [Planctomycetota bacterium]